MCSFFKFSRNNNIVGSLAILMLLFGCKTTYNDASFHAALSNAIEKDKRVIIETKDNVNIKFKNVVYEDDIFYGIQKIEGEKVKVPLDLINVKSIRAESKVMLGIAKGALMGVIGALFIMYVVADIAYGSDNDDD